jgi:DNA-binding NtrC family response regulator
MQSSPMSSCRLIICEKSTHWALSVRVALAGKPPKIVETRALAQAEAALAVSPASLVALESTAANLDAILEFLSRARANYPDAQLVALLAGESALAAPLLREAGAIDVFQSIHGADRLARMARRQFARTPTTEPLTMSELIAERLPWPAYARQN